MAAILKTLNPLKKSDFLQCRLHLKMFSWFGQLFRLREGDNVLAKHALPSVWTPSPYIMALIQAIQAEDEEPDQVSCAPTLA